MLSSSVYLLKAISYNKPILNLVQTSLGYFHFYISLEALSELYVLLLCRLFSKYITGG